MQGNLIVLLVFPMWLLTSWFELLDARRWKYSSSPPAKCNLPPVTGMCKAAFPRFYYDTKTRQCEFFLYGGCQGNENRFESPLDCIWECERFDRPPEKCRLPAAKGTGKILFKRYYYDFNNKVCRTLIYRGEGGNKNNFQSLQECIEQCAQFERMPAKCDLPKETGLCKASFPRYYFNVKSGRCEEFRYGGCGGNDNNFETEIDCIRNCESYSGW
ncbi:carboxypeptidase inhibitor SmCI-like [Pogona vitticeps]